MDFTVLYNRTGCALWVLYALWQDRQYWVDYVAPGRNLQKAEHIYSGTQFFIFDDKQDARDFAERELVPQGFMKIKSRMQ